MKRRGRGIVLDDYSDFINGISKSFALKLKSDIWTIDDLKQEAVIIFCKCKRSFDEKKNVKFFTLFFESVKNRFLAIAAECVKYPSIGRDCMSSLKENDLIDHLQQFGCKHESYYLSRSLYNNRENGAKSYEYDMPNLDRHTPFGYLDCYLGTVIFHNADCLLSFNRTIKALPESALNTLKAIINYDGAVGAKMTRNRKKKGGRASFKMTAKDLKAIIKDKTERQIKKDLLIIKEVLT
jgi:hypothetical protein